MSPRNILLVVSLLLSVLIGAVLSRRTEGHAGTRPNPAHDGRTQLVIGLSMDTLKEARWQADRDMFVARAQELGAKVLVQAANSDDTVQMKDCESLIASHVDVLVIVPHDGVAMAKAVEKAAALGIPVIAYDRLIKNADVTLYTSFDNVEVGRQQARYLLGRLQNRGSIVRIYGAPTDNNAKLFKQGQDEILEPLIAQGAIKVVHEDWTEEWKPENAKRILQAAITKGAKFDAVLAANDGTAGGAIQALEEEKLTGILVTGQDAELAACQRIAAGTQAMTIYKPVRTLARGAAELAVALAKHEIVIANATTDNGRRAVPSLLHRVITVDQGNLAQTVVADGFHSYEDVYRGVPAERRPPPPQP